MPIQPVLILVTPWQDPPNTFRAKVIHDMYSIAAVPDTFNITYEIGIPPTIVPRKFAYRNNTQSNELQLDLAIPPIWICDTPSPIIVLRNTTVEFTLSFNEAHAKAQSIADPAPDSEFIFLKTTPLQVNGPVYVFNDLPPLTVS